METLLAWYYFINCEMVPTVQPQFSWYSGNDWRTRIIDFSYNDYALDSSVWSELDERVPCRLKLINDSWRVDETYIKVKG